MQKNKILDLVEPISFNLQNPKIYEINNHT